MSLGKRGETLKKYFKITGAYSESFAELVDYNLLLPNKEDKITLQTPPPSYYFLPFYIDQKKSWVEPWSSFERLSQFSAWKPNVVKYCSGYINDEYFELEEDVSHQKSIKSTADQNITRMSNALEVIDDVDSESIVTFNKEDFDEVQIKVKEDLTETANRQTNLLSGLTACRNEIYDLEKQIEIVQQASNELNEDYKFSVEVIEGDVLECPLCGTEHDNSLSSRALILKDKYELDGQFDSLSILLMKKKDELSRINSELEFVRAQVVKLNEKYFATDDSAPNRSLALTTALNSLAKSSVTKSVESKKVEQESILQRADSAVKKIKREQSKLISKGYKEDLDGVFMGNLIEANKVLGSEGIDLSKVNRPADYNSIDGGGAAEGARGILAYQISIIKQIEFAGNCKMSPFVIDTPNQQEQAIKRYDTVIKVIMDNTPKTIQIFVCGMKNDALEPFVKEAHVINLDQKKLLVEDRYIELNDEYLKIPTSDE
ncbi:hypothetical protein AB6E39_26110 [Vibrio splendidus]|uniref:hypothetical protein n=1 Tax=Vibrio splendidus TaxID=29497 RepID=UPI001E61F0BF|nr:hypothetical protein [Vibrio splendidus]MCC4791187.1 hypothetical protein [Vibrio splendidus]